MYVYIRMYVCTYVRMYVSVPMPHTEVIVIYQCEYINFYYIYIYCIYIYIVYNYICINCMLNTHYPDTVIILYYYSYIH